MGTFIYGTDCTTIELEDRLLDHLRVVIVGKLRRHDGFAFSWANSDDTDEHNRETIWLHPSIPLRFCFTGNRPVTLNPLWIEALTAAANSNQGLYITPEPRQRT